MQYSRFVSNSPGLLRQARACLPLDPGEEGLERFLHDPLERRFLGPVPLVGEGCVRPGGPRCRRMKGESRAQARCAGHGWRSEMRTTRAAAS